jgi:hypothetical protein
MRLPDYGVGLIVEDIEKNDEWLEDIEEDWPHRQALQRLPVVPELNVWIF